MIHGNPFTPFVFAAFLCLAPQALLSQGRSIAFVQDSIQIPVVNNRVKLQKKDFSMEILLKDMDVVVLNASSSFSNVDSFQKGRPSGKLACFRDAGRV